jgi:ABC-type uncharacterized transport system substrate-binding protein
MNNRRRLVIALGAGALALPYAGMSRDADKMRRVGFVVPNPVIASRRLAALRAGLSALGYVEKKNLVIETRWPAGRERRLRDIPQELIDAGVEVIVIHGGTAMRETLSALAAQKLSIPVVMATGSGGAPQAKAGEQRMVTGLLDAPDPVPKQIELLRALVPNLTRLAVLSNTTFPGHPAIDYSVNAAIQKTRITALPFHAEKSNEIDAAFSEIVKAGAQAIVVAVDPVVEGAGQQIARLALQHKLPTLFGDGDHVRTGGLISYGENLERTYRRAAVYIDKLLKGNKASALPIERTKLDLTINQKTAGALGIRIPAAVLARADKVWRA